MSVLKLQGVNKNKAETRHRGCLKSWLLFRHLREFKIKSLYSNDLILNIASKSKETVQKLKFLNSPVQRQVFLTKNLLLCGTTDVRVGNDTLSVFSSGTDAARIKQTQV